MNRHERRAERKNIPRGSPIPKTETVDDLFAFAKDTVEKVFLESGVIAPVLIVDTAHHERSLIGLPQFEESHELKHAIKERMPELLRAMKATRYAQIAEVWLSSSGHDRPSEDPKRREAVVANVFDKGGLGNRLAIAYIVRVEDGSPPSLEPWEEVGVSDYGSFFRPPPTERPGPMKMH